MSSSTGTSGWSATRTRRRACEGVTTPTSSTPTAASINGAWKYLPPTPCPTRPSSVACSHRSEPSPAPGPARGWGTRSVPVRSALPRCKSVDPLGNNTIGAITREFVAVGWPAVATRWSTASGDWQRLEPHAHGLTGCFVWPYWVLRARRQVGPGAFVRQASQRTTPMPSVEPAGRRDWTHMRLEANGPCPTVTAVRRLSCAV